MSKVDKALDTVNEAAGCLEKLGEIAGWIGLNLVWIILAGAAAYLGRDSWDLTQEGKTIEGVVSSMREVEATAESGVTWAPVIDYTIEGKNYTFISNSSSDPPAYTVGEKVTMLYNPREPGTAQINSWWSLWGLSAMLGGAAVVILIISLWMAINWMRNR